MSWCNHAKWLALSLVFFSSSALADPYGYSHRVANWEWESLVASGGGSSSYTHSTVGWNWQSCSRTGSGPRWDDSYSTVSIGFNFPFHGNTYSTTHIGSNGFLGFGSTSRMRDYSPDPIPRTYAPNNIVAPLWTDLNPSRGGSIWYCRTWAYGQQALIVNYAGVPYYWRSYSNTFQVILLANGEIRFNYDYVRGYRTYTTGVENQSGNGGLQVWRRSSTMNDVSIRISPGGGGGATTGNAQYVSFSDDSVRGGYNLGFNFDFYGDNFTQAWFSSNGFLAFQNPWHSWCCHGRRLGVGQGPRAVVAGYWNDINHSSGLYGTLGSAPNRRFVFQHSGREYYYGPVQQYQVVLHEGTNNIRVNLKNVRSNRHRVTTGIQNRGRNYHQTYIYGYPGHITNRSILFERDNSAELNWVNLTTHNESLPGLRGAWELNRAAQTRSRLYLNSSVSGTGCNGGTLIKDTNHGSTTSVNHDFNNIASWHVLERARSYCLQVDVLDDWGNRRSAARTITHNNPAVTGSLDQANGSATITASWSHSAGNNTRMELVQNENCTGQVVVSGDISWNATGNVSRTYTIDRNQSYCARLIMGGATRTHNLGMLHHASFSSVAVSLADTSQPTLRASYTLNHAAPVTLRLYENSSTSNNLDCSGGTEVGGTLNGSAQSEMRDWQSHAASSLVRGATYCVSFRADDGGLARKAVQYTIPDNSVAVSGSLNQTGASATVNASWTGNAGGLSSITLYQSANCGSNYQGTQAIAWNQSGGQSHTFTNLVRGHDYCARLAVGQLTQTVHLGRLNFGSISTLSLTGNNTDVSLSVSWQLTHSAPHSAVLYENSSDGGNNCSGGNDVWSQNFAASATGSVAWNNSAGWQELERGRDYCIQLTVDDGGGSTTADAFSIGAPGHSLGFSMDQDEATVTLTGTWGGRAGADSGLMLYANQDCSGNPLASEGVAWDRQTSQTKTWNTGSGLVRGTRYCGALKLGGIRITRDLGVLEDYARVTSLDLTLSSAAEPTLSGNWQLSRQSPVTISLYKDSVRSGSTCSGGTLVDGPHSLPNMAVGGYNWNNSTEGAFLERGRTYCMTFATTDGGGETGAREYTIPDNITQFIGWVDQEESAFGAGGAWSGSAGGNAWLRLYANATCSGAHVQHVPIGWQATSSEVFDHMFRGAFTRGVDYCARLQLGAVSRTVSVGSLGFASFRNVAFAVTNSDIPRLTATWGLSYVAQTVMELRENSVASGNSCSGGSQFASATLDSSDAFTRVWENSSTSHLLRRGRSYCLFLSTSDGGESKVARDVTVGAAGLGVSGSLDQVNARVTVVGAWSGFAGAAAQVKLYANAACSGNELYATDIAWNQHGGVSHTFDSATLPNIVRGQDYCGRIVLGDSTTQASLGRLEFATFTNSQFTVHDSDGPTLRSHFVLSYAAPVTTKLYGGGFNIVNNRCSGGDLVAEATAESTAEHTRYWASSAAAPLMRGGSYCMDFQIEHAGGRTAALDLTLPDNIESLSGSIDQAAGSFTITGAWGGQAGAGAALSLYANAACSGQAAASHAIAWNAHSTHALPHTFTGNFARGVSYCAKLVLGRVSRTAALGELDFAHISAAQLTVANSSTPALSASWTMSHAAASRTTLYRNSHAQGNACTVSASGLDRVELDVAEHGAAVDNSRQWQNSLEQTILERNRSYCLAVEGRDGGSSARAAQVSIPGGTPAISGSISQVDKTLSASATWQGNAGGAARLEFFKSADCTGAAAFYTQDILPLQAEGRSVSISSAEVPAIERGYDYCAKITLGGSSATVHLGSLDFASIDSASLALSDAHEPSLATGLALSHESPFTVVLYDGSTRAGDTCSGGVAVRTVTGASSSHSETFTSSSQHPFTRGGSYCATFAVNDGGNARAARDYTVPTNIHALGGTINQQTAAFTVTGTWTGLAGSGAALYLYQNATCSGAPLQSQTIAWDGQSSAVLPYTFTAAGTPYARGQHYCVRLRLGNVSSIHTLGELEYAHLTAASLVSGDEARPTLQANWSLSHATGVRVSLYKGSAANGNQCSGGDLVATEDPLESDSGTLEFDNTGAWTFLSRGVSYCATIQARDGGNSLRAVSVVVPDGSPTISGSINQVDGAIHIETTWSGRAGANASIQLYRSDDCTGTAIAVHTMGFDTVGPVEGVLFAQDTDVIARGYPYCARIRLGDSVATASLGMFEFVEFSAAELTLSSSHFPALRAGYTLTHDSPVRVQLRFGATLSNGDTCIGGSQVGTEQVGGGQTFGAAFQSSQLWPLQRGGVYCAQFLSTDSGSARAAATYTVPDGVVSFTGQVDQVGGSITVSGEWTGLAGDTSKLSLYADATCSGAAIREVDIEWDALSATFFSHTFQSPNGFERGSNYCAALRIGAVTHTAPLGELQYAHIENPAFTVTHGHPPSVRATWQMNHRAGARTTLYEGATAAGHSCDGGTAVSSSELLADQNFHVDWENTADWEHLARGRVYCAHIETVDGGTSQVALDLLLPSGNPVLTGAIDQSDGRLSLNAAWDGLAAHDSQLEIYKNSDCSGPAAHTQTIAWSRSAGEDFTYEVGLQEWVTRGTSYCATLRLGDGHVSVAMGTLEYAAFTDARVTAHSLSDLSLASSFTTNHRVTVVQTLHQGGSAEGGECVGGTPFGDGVSVSASAHNQVWSSQASLPLQRGALYCVQFVAQDSGSAKAAAQYRVPDNITALGGLIDQETGSMTVNGGFAGIAGGGAHLDLFATEHCEGAAVQSAALVWNQLSGDFFAHTFSPPAQGFTRGVSYCVRLVLGQVNRIYPLGELSYAHLATLTLDVANADLASLTGTWSLSHATGSRSVLFRGGEAVGNSCGGGASAVASETHTHANHVSKTFANSATWQHLERGQSYCLEVSVTDGGGAQSARDVLVPSNVPALSGSIDQAAATIALNGTWSGQAGANARLELYKNASCSGAPIATTPVGYQAEVPYNYTFTPADVVAMERGASYCAKLTLGQVSTQIDLGELVFAEFLGADLGLSESNGPTLVASHEMNHAVHVTQQLFYGGEVVANRCTGGSQMETTRTTITQMASELWTSSESWPLRRGGTYCMEWFTTDGGGASSAMLYTIPSNIQTLSGVVNQETALFTIDASWGGYAGAGASLSLFATASCTGAPIRQVNFEWNAESTAHLPHEFAPGDDGFQRGRPYCVQLRLGDAVATFELGELAFAHIVAPSFVVSDGETASLTASWSLSHATTTRSLLFKNSVAAGNECEGGESQEWFDHGHSQSFTRTWQNVEGQVFIERGVPYCVQVMVTDGGDAHTARSVMAPLNNPVLDGVIDQVSAEITLSATWAGQAAGASRLELYQGVDCGGDSLTVLPIAYSSQNGMVHTFSAAELPGLTRGHSYCARLILGTQVEMVELGSLDFVSFESAQLTLADGDTPSVRVSYSLNHDSPVVLELYRGASVVGADTCSGGVMAFAGRTTEGESHIETFASEAAHPLHRGTSYCVQLSSTDSGGAQAAAAYVVPGSITAFSGSINQDEATIAVSGTWTGQAGGGASVKIFANANCSGEAEADRSVAWNERSTQVLPHTFDPGGTGLERGRHYCAQLLLGSDIRTIDLGELEYGFVDAMSLTSNNLAAPTLNGSWSLNHRVATESILYRHAQSAGHVCAGAQKVEIHRATHGVLNTVSQDFQNTLEWQELARDNAYCLEVRVLDGLGYHTARNFEIPDNDSFLNGDIDIDTTEVTLSGFWTGNAAASAHFDLFANSECSGESIDSAVIAYDTSDGATYTVDETTLPTLLRGQSYCGQLTLGGVVHQLDLGSLPYADITDLEFTVSNPDGPALFGTWTLEPNGPTSAALYQGANVNGDGSACVGGVQVAASGATQPHGDSGTWTWNNTSDWHPLQRGTRYCVQVGTEDGGGASRAASATIAATGLALSGAIDQDNALLSFDASWDGQAGENGTVVLYGSADCTQNPIAIEAVPWNYSGLWSHTWDQADHVGIVRGLEYCARLILGQEVRDYPLGLLVEWSYVESFVLSAEVVDTPSVRASWVLSQDEITISKLFRGASAEGTGCSGGDLIATETHQAAGRTILWENSSEWHELQRGRDYCVELHVQDTGGDRAATTTALGDAGLSLTSQVDQNATTFTLTAGWQGNAGGATALTLYKSADCSEDPLRVVDVPWNTGSGIQETFNSVNTPGLERGASYCAKMVLGGAEVIRPLGELHFSTVGELNFAMTDGWDPTLGGGWTLTPMSTSTAELFEGASEEDGRCVGGTSVLTQSFGHEQAPAPSWQNTGLFKRGAIYCLEVNTTDGGEEHAARELNIPANNPVLTASLNQITAAVTVEATWDGFAGASSSVSLYRSANCGSQLGEERPIAWNTAGGDSFDFSEADGSVIRGFDYCVALDIGEVRLTQPLGFLVAFGLFDQAAFAVDDIDEPSLTATWTLSQPTVTTTKLYRNSVVNEAGDACIGTGSELVLEEQHAHLQALTHGFANHSLWQGLSRGYEYCLQILTDDGGDQRVAHQVYLGGTMGFITGALDEYAPGITVSASWSGRAGDGPAYLGFYPASGGACGGCSPDEANRRDIVWNALGGDQHTFIDVSEERLVRGMDYCSCVRLGELVSASYIGTLGEVPPRYRETLLEVSTSLEDLQETYDDEDFAEDLVTARGHIAQAIAYWDARTALDEVGEFANRQIQWGPSFRRAQKSVEEMVRARTSGGPGALRGLESRVGSVMLYEARLRASVSQTAIDDTSPGWWMRATQLSYNTAQNGFQSLYGLERADAAGDAYDAAAPIYEQQYQAMNQVSRAHVAIDEQLAQPREDRPRLELISAIDAVMISGLKAELESAVDVSATGRESLEAVIARLDNIGECLEALAAFTLNNKQFTLCYLDVVQIVEELESFESALVNTHTWRAMLGYTVFALLDISLYHGSDPLVNQPGIESDPEGIEAFENYALGLLELRNGDIDSSLQRYVRNDCLIVRLFNRYYAIAGGGTNNDPIPEGAYCPDEENECLVPDTCTGLASCVDRIVGYECLCDEGFELNNIQECTDVDECTYGISNCSPVAVCINEVGGFSCECPEGFSGDFCSVCQAGYVGVQCDECDINGGYTEFPPATGVCIEDPCFGEDCLGLDTCSTDGTQVVTETGVCSVLGVGSFSCSTNGISCADGLACNDVSQLGGACVVEPFFSEYLEGSSWNKAVELYNPNERAFSLSDCSLEIYSNGSLDVGYSVSIDAVFEAESAFVVCNDRMDDEQLGRCDLLDNSLIFNGDDAVTLVCGDAAHPEFRRTADVIGQVGMDPGASWGNGQLSTKNATLRRSCDVSAGDTNTADAFSPSEEFTNQGIDVFDDLGQHCE